MKEMSTQERRKLKRRSLSYYMLVTDPTTNKTVGHLVDITPKGFMMDTQYQIPPHRECHFRLDTTADVATKSFIEITARSVWVAPDAVEVGLFDIGFEITTMTEEDADILQRIVDKYGDREKIVS
jgi:hypothetical protein